MNVPKNLSPENAIKNAYDFARTLRYLDAAGEQLPEHLVRWVEPFASSSLYRYLRAGFVAGYKGDTLPWRRDIDAASASRPD